MAVKLRKKRICQARWLKQVEHSTGLSWASHQY
jgi:hypothetical protein